MGISRDFYGNCQNPLFDNDHRTATSPGGHAFEDELGYVVDVVVVVGGAATEGAGNDGSQSSSLFSGELRGRFIKMALSLEMVFASP